MLPNFDSLPYFWAKPAFMATIALQGMRFFAPHGYYEEEQILGNEFLLDVMVNTETDLAAESDDLYLDLGEDEDEDAAIPTTVNYETIYLLCQVEMKKPTRLLEAVVERIADRLIEQFDNITGLYVRLRKKNPPLGGNVSAAWVMIAKGDLSGYLPAMD